MYRYIYLLLLIALGGGTASAQQSFSAPGGFTVRVGDSLQFGLPAPAKSYIYVFDRLSQEGEELPSRFKEALPFSRAKVEGYKLFASDSTSAKLDTFLVLRHPRFPDDSLFLDLREAVSSGEVLVSDPIRFSTPRPKSSPPTSTCLPSSERATLVQGRKRKNSILISSP